MPEIERILRIVKAKPYLLGLLIAGIVALPYIPALQIYLIGDDFECLNAVYSGWKNPLVIFQRIGLFFRPVLQFSYLVKYTLFKTNTTLFMAATILVHLVNVFLLYKLLFTITKKLTVAAITALLFGISAMHCEAVLWAGGHSDSLLLLFFLGTCLLLANQEAASGVKQQGILLCMILGAAGAKETWLVLPFLMVGFLLLIRRVPLKKAMIASVPAFLILCGYVLIFIILPRLTDSSSPIAYTQSNIKNMVNKAAYLLYRYLGLGDYFYGDLWQIALIFVLFTGLFVLLIALQNGLAAWGLIWMILTIGITLPVYYAPSRYNYVPLAGFWIMVVALSAQLFRILTEKYAIRCRLLIPGIIAAVGYLIAYNILMLQVEIKDYRRLGDAVRTVVAMYRDIQDQIRIDQPLIFVNMGTRKAVTEAAQSAQGYSKLLFVRAPAIWEMVYFSRLANFAGEPFTRRMIPVRAEDLKQILHQAFQMIIFTDQGFLFGNQTDRQALQTFYETQQRLPHNVEAYQFVAAE